MNMKPLSGKTEAPSKMQDVEAIHARRKSCVRLGDALATRHFELTYQTLDRDAATSCVVLHKHGYLWCHEMPTEHRQDDDDDVYKH
jgi:hypothetical protein